MIKNFYIEEIERLKEKGLYRSTRLLKGAVDASVVMDGREVILLSSNNYLGLANHPALKLAAVSAVEKYGTGAGASRLVSGNMEIHESLEKRIAEFKGCESALLFSSGYAANIGIITALARRGDIIFSDEFNHASIIDGCRLSRADTRIYPHRDMKNLRRMLSDAAQGFPEQGRRMIILSDGIFSMDGDMAALPDILEAAKQYGALIIVDDAHATGVIGPGGRGTVAHFGLHDEALIQMGTFSKALGSLGGFVAGSEPLVEFLRNRARSFIYSTALPPSVCAASMAALDLLGKDPSLIESLKDNTKTLVQGFRELGFNVMGDSSHIIPLLIGDTNLTMRFAEELLEGGVYAPGIRPPTVPEGASRIRVSPMASHAREQLLRALDIFEKAGRRLGII